MKPTENKGNKKKLQVNVNDIETTRKQETKIDNKENVN